MDTRLLVAAAVAVTTAWGTTGPGLNVAGAAQDHPSEHTVQAQPPNMAEMMKKHEQMMGDMKAGDGKLDALVKEMNGASGDVKVNAIAAVVNELVRQHKGLHERMGQMHQQMMGMGRGRMMRQ